jgi:hypothetical protein
MNAHQLYAHGLVASITSADIAHFYDPKDPEPSTEVGRRRRVTSGLTVGELEELHATVLMYADSDTLRAWSVILANATKEPRGDRSATWALPLSKFMIDIPQEQEPESRRLEMVAD